jgi:hypothetical protein
MKRTNLLLVLVFLSCASQVVNAQYGYGSQQRQQRRISPAPVQSTQNSIELKNPYEVMSIILPKCVEAFKLDDFEKEIIKGILLKKLESQNVILGDEDSTVEDKKKKLKEINKVFYKELALILSAEEIEQFKVMDFSETREDKKKKKKDKKKRKSRKT